MIKVQISLPPNGAARVSESKKITINLSFVDLGRIDLLVSEGVYANQSDFNRTPIRNQIDRHSDVTRHSVARKRVELGLRRYDRAEFEAVRANGKMLDIRVLGLAVIADDVTPDYAEATIA